MADDINVNFGAQIAGLLAGVRGSTQGIQSFVSTSKSAIDGLTGSFQKLQNMMLGIAAIAAGGAMFSSIVSGATEATGAVVGLTKTFGMGLKEASILRVELATLGISTEDYTAAALRLDRQVRTNEADLRKFGITTRDANGQLLSQKDLISSAVSWLGQYKAGTDRNMAAQTAFGRGAGDTVLQLMKMSATTRAVAEETASSLQLMITPEQATNAREYKTAMRQLSLSMEGISNAIGNAVLPYLTRFAQWFRDQGPTIITNMQSIVKDAVSIAFDLAVGLVNALSSIMTGLFNLFVAYQYVKAKLGFTTEDVANKAIDGFEQILDKIEAARAKAVAVLGQLKTVAMEGGPKGPPLPEAGPPGTKSASSLIVDKDAGKAAQKAIDGELAVLRAGFDRKKMMLDDDVANFKIREDQKYEKLQQMTQSEYNLELQALQRKLGLANMDKTQRQTVENEITQLHQKHLTDMLRLDQQSVAARRQMYLDLANTIKGSWDGQLRGLITGQVTFAQAFKNILLDLGIEFIKFAEKTVIEWGAAQLAKATATQTGAAASAAAETAGQTATLPIRAAKFISDITADAALVFAGIFANLSPLLGPAAAGPAAAGQMGVMAEMAAVPKFEQGAYRIPRVMPAILHPGERVLNAKEAAQSRGEAEGGGGGTAIHLSFIDAAGAAAFISKNAGAMASAVANHQKRNRSTRPVY